MKTIMFMDPCAPDPYSVDTLKIKSLGGTEASCIRIVEQLALRDYNVILSQRGRFNYHTDIVGKGTISYCPQDTNYAENSAEIKTVITLRDAGFFLKNYEKYPHATHYLWMHDVASGLYTEHLQHHLHSFLVKFPKVKPNVICVSNWHSKQVSHQLFGIPLNITTIYGPLAEYCVKNPNTAYDPYKLIFFSSPHKGLEGTLEIFKRLHSIDPLYRLYISNPGYFKDATDLPEGVINLGSLPHHEILIGHVRSSLCTFYPNTIFEETFGLVMAESEAVGTPVLAHPIGAAPEVLSHPKSLVDCTNPDTVVQRVIDWHNGTRPIVRGKREFTMQEVIKEWIKII